MSIRNPASIRPASCHRLLSAIVGLSAVCAAPSVHAKGKPGGGGGGGKPKDIPVDVHFDADHTTADGNVTGPPNGITADSNPYSDGNGVEAFVGRNNGIWLYLGGSGRTLNIDLSQPLGCDDSVPVDLVTDVVGSNDVTIVSTSPDGVSDYCYHDPAGSSPLRPQPPAGVFSVDAERFEIAAGIDLDDLEVGCVVETNARLRFQDAAGNDWRLMWGPRQIPGGWMPNPRSGPIRLTRVNQAVIDGQTVDGNFWFFETAGAHLASLHRRENQQAGNYFEYYGQFTVPFSGYAVAQSYDPNLTGNHCDLNIPNIGSGLVRSNVGLAHDAQNNLLTATAVDQSDDFSAAPASFDWYADGNLLVSGTGNILDLAAYPDVGTVTVFATHPDWLALLPGLQTITQGEVEGSADITLGGGNGGGDTMSADALSWNFPRGGKDVQVVITIVDASGDPLAGVEVAATLDGPGGISIPISATTNSNGQVSERERNAPDGQWCVTLVEVHDPSSTYTWDNTQPAPNCTTKS